MMYDTKGIMKSFITDRLVDEENFCNFLKERERLRDHIDQKNHVVVFGPRNFGKTSLLKNILIKEFRKSHKKSFVFFADLMEVKSMDMVVSRLKHAFEHSFEDSFPVKNMLQTVAELLTAIRPEITIDPLTSQPSLSLTLSKEKRQYSIPFIFQLILSIAKKMPCLVVIDEFQDIAAIPEAQAFFRSAFQEINESPIILLGSKRHILSKLFSNPDAPLAFWGQDVEIGEIAYEDYHHYIQERLAQQKNSIDLDTSMFMQDLVRRVPESINALGSQLMSLYTSTHVTQPHVVTALKTLLETKESRYESYLSQFSVTEQSVLENLSQTDRLTQPQSQAFVSKTGLTSKSVGTIMSKLQDRGIVDQNKGIYRICDPLLAHYIEYYR